jgi:hypothetical protein
MKSDEERFREALEDIANHFDDQSFPRHKEFADCASIMVNYAVAVLDGCPLDMGEWFEYYGRRLDRREIR